MINFINYIDVLKSMWIIDQSSFQNDLRFFVSLFRFDCEFVCPTQSVGTLFTENISDKMHSRDHHSLLHFSSLDVDHFSEQISPATSSCERLRGQIIATGQWSVTFDAWIKDSPIGMLQVQTSHDLTWSCLALTIPKRSWIPSQTVIKRMVKWLEQLTWMLINRCSDI